MMDFLYIGVSRIHRNMANLIQTLHTVSAIEKHGINTTLFLPPKKGNLDIEKRLSQIGISIKLNIKFTQFLHSRWKNLDYRPLFWFYKRAFKKAKIIYVRSPRLSLCMLKKKIPHCIEIHNTEELVREKWLDPIIYSHKEHIIKHIFPISKSAAKFLIRSGADPKRVTIVPSGVDISVFKNIRPFDPNRLKFPNIFYIGRISKDRGLDILSYLARRGLGRVYLVGEVEGEIEYETNLNYLGFVHHSEVVSYYEQSDILLMPYQKELYHISSISPLKLFEAMAAGRPIIASDIPPIREILVHQQNALLADPTDVDSWISCIEILKNDPFLAQRIALNAKKHVSTYSWEERARKIITALNLK